MVFNLADDLFRITDKFKARDTIQIGILLSQCFLSGLDKYNVGYVFGEGADSTKNFDIALSTLRMLKYTIISRIIGERYLSEYLDAWGKQAVSENNAKEDTEKISEATKQEFENNNINALNSAVTLIIKARDILFNGKSTILDVPAAPRVTLNYETMQTNEEFGSDYQYCFADGEWKDCSGAISFTVKRVKQILRVRKKASETETTGNIATVIINAQPKLNAQIGVRFDGESYTLSKLPEEFSYYVCLVNDSDNYEENCFVKTGITTENNVIQCSDKYAYMLIRTCSTEDSYQSEFVKINVEMPIQMDILCDDGLTVTKPDVFFDGDIVTLKATAEDGYIFKGWYKDGQLVSTDEEFTFNAYASAEIRAASEKTKASVTSIEITSVSKMNYLENEDFDPSTLIVIAHYDFAEDKQITSFDVYGYEKSYGEKTVTVSYMGCSADVKVFVDHVAGEWVIETESTCTTEGTKIRQCTVCNALLETACVPVTEHTYNEVVIYPTCSEEGYTVHTCSVCGDSYTDSVVEKLSHTYVDTVVASTCTAEGYTFHICSICGDSYTNSVTEKLGHTYEDIVVVPTCTTDGYTKYVCMACGESYVDSIVPAKGHSYQAITNKPTCENDGSVVEICSICGDTGTVEILKATGHNDSDSDGICDSCGKQLDASKNCSCLCHKSGFMGFIYKIVRIFWKLFRIKKTCACGTVHY